MVGEIQLCQFWWLMLDVDFEQSVSTVASRGVGHNRTVSSMLPEAKVRPSGLNATPLTAPVWPCSWPRGPGWAGSVRFHNRTVKSVLAEAKVCPSGLNTTLYTGPLWPRRESTKAGRAGSVRFHNRTVES